MELPYTLCGRRTGDRIAKRSSSSCKEYVRIFRKKGLGVVVITYDTVPIVADFAKRPKNHLPDPGATRIPNPSAILAS
jgi:hypothetical protein